MLLQAIEQISWTDTPPNTGTFQRDELVDAEVAGQ